MNTNPRDETKLLLARQLAQFNGVNPNEVLKAGKLRTVYMTLAENLLSTVERKMGNFRWQ